jgi:hypothetical protein
VDPGTRIYSCDDHLDLPAVPRELWQSRLARAQAEGALPEADRRKVTATNCARLYGFGGAS